MEQPREFPQKSVIAIIPARYASTRLSGKLLRTIAGKPMILHTLDRVRRSKTVARVIVATDNERIREVVAAYGGEAVMTSTEHQSGSDRLAEVAKGLAEDSVIVNVQGDEPLIAAATIDAAVTALLDDPAAQMATTCEPIRSVNTELLDPNVVKVVVSDAGYAVYFSRSPIPFPREAALRWGGDLSGALKGEPDLLRLFKKHTGLYVYRREFLLEYADLPRTALEQTEMLEQLRALEYGAKIRVVEVNESSIGVDTERDLERVRIQLEQMPFTFGEGTEADAAETANVYIETVRSSFRGIYPDEYLDSLEPERRTREALERFSRADYRLFTARTADGLLIGFADRGRRMFEQVEAETQIYSIYVLPDYQGFGAGRQLFEMCLANAGTLCLETPVNSPFRRFYERLGGRDSGRGSHIFGDDVRETIIYSWDTEAT